MPQVVFRTRDIIRAVVRVEGIDLHKVQVGIDTDVNPMTPSTLAGKSGPRTTINEEDFLSILSQKVGSKEVEFTRQILKDMMERGCTILCALTNRMYMEF